MTRTFHNSPSLLSTLSTIMLITAAGYFFWVKMVGGALLCLIIAILAIERTLHTQYTICDDTDEPLLIIHRGRLSRDSVIPIAQIASITTFSPTRFLFLIPRGDAVVIIMRAKPRPIIITPSTPHLFVDKIAQLKTS